jgi:hypothetical protein
MVFILLLLRNIFHLIYLSYHNLSYFLIHLFTITFMQVLDILGQTSNNLDNSMCILLIKLYLFILGSFYNYLCLILEYFICLLLLFLILNKVLLYCFNNLVWITTNSIVIINRVYILMHINFNIISLLLL